MNSITSLVPLTTSSEGQEAICVTTHNQPNKATSTPVQDIESILIAYSSSTDPPESANKTPVPSNARHLCKTQPSQQDSLHSIFVGMSNTIYRFVPDSTITFNTNRDSFPSSEDADHATNCLEEAAGKWNDGKIGVTIDKVADNKPAVFQLTYAENSDPTSLADSFFPNWILHGEQPKVFVYRTAFTSHRDNLSSIFCHELGHVLGLRHEFAQTDPKEQKWLSMQIGECNNQSVMNYFPDLSKLSIQESDYVGARELYGASGGTHYGEFKIEDVAPKDFAPKDLAPKDLASKDSAPSLRHG